MAKRLFDIVSSAMGLLLTGLPMVLITIAIKLLDPGPVLYRQRRIGRGGQPFWLYKFRTMKVCESGPVVTIEGDPRVTPIGRFLRRWKLDELPQLWNVLRGEMSVVGPRPEIQRFVDLYTQEQRRLLQQNPGLASLSQLVYPHEADLLRQNPDPEEHLRPAIDAEKNCLGRSIRREPDLLVGLKIDCRGCLVDSRCELS